jgi:hypothetical protein
VRPDRSEILTHGVLAGLLGYATVVVFYAVWNALHGRSPFYTAALLGATLFYGLRQGAEVVVWAGPVLAFNGVHLVIFLGVGLLAAWIATESERGAHYWYIGLSLLVYGSIHVIGLVLWIADPLRDRLPIWSAVVASVVALGAMAVYLFGVHPRLRQELVDYDEDE